MCHLGNDRSRNRGIGLRRRHFLRLAGAGVVGLAATASSFAAPAKAVPKPENILSPDAALDRLMKGNERYVEGIAKRHDFRHEREALTKGQNPFAGVLSCADSRLAPEYAFDAGRGDQVRVPRRRKFERFQRSDPLGSP
jgi:carbonic anhydrase